MDLHGVLVVDKPRGPTSHDVVARVRRLLHTKRVGHAGTLDPAAEGVLLVAVGRATQLIDLLQAGRKQYAARVVLGYESVSGDIEGPVVVANPDIRPITAEVEQALRGFVGEVEQTPPAHSAIKVGGQPLYRAARRDETVSVPSRRVTIFGLWLLRYDYPELDILVDCSTGTYIRALARDLGAALGSGGYLHALLRTRVEPFSLADAWSLADLDRLLRPESFSLMALHPASAIPGSVTLALDSSQTRAWYDGRPVPQTGGGRTGERAAAFGSAGGWSGMAALEATTGAWLPRLVVGST